MTRADEPHALPGLEGPPPLLRPPGCGVYPIGADAVTRDAQLSDDANYRYQLLRRWGDGPAATFVMLNPSTADGRMDDPTIRRCVGFARALGCGALVVVNLYAYRTSTPTTLWNVPDPVGPENDACIARAVEASKRCDAPLIVAWGVNAEPQRVDQVMAIPGMDRAHALGVTVNGSPRHPLYLPADSRPLPWGRA